MLTAILLSGAIAMNAAQVPAEVPEPWESLGEWRISVYCEACNDPGGRITASGIPLESGHVAMNGVPMGSTISVEGEEFTVTDRCGIDGTVDIFIPSPDGACHCNTLDFEEVYIKTEESEE